MGAHALCIGINDYPRADADLYGCVNDARDWEALLQAQGFKTEVLLDADATWQGITDGIARTIEGATSGDAVVITYSGHGSYVQDLDGDEPDEVDEVFCPHDIFDDRPLTDDQLYDLFADAARGVRIALIADSCHSGSVARARLPLGEADDLPKERTRFLAPGAWAPRERVDRMRERTTSHRPRRRPHEALLLAGCQDTQTSADAYLDGRYNGAFTYYALKALELVSADATYAQWFRTIRELLPNRRYGQQPNLQGSRTQRGWRILAEG
jgi:hypothetical protein